MAAVMSKLIPDIFQFLIKGYTVTMSLSAHQKVTFNSSLKDTKQKAKTEDKK